MVHFFLDANLLLRSSAPVDVRARGNPDLYVYFSRIRAERNVFIVVPVKNAAETPLLPEDTLVHVAGWADRIGDVVLVSDPTILVNARDVATPDVAATVSNAHAFQGATKGCPKACTLKAGELTVDSDGVPTWTFRV
ncbi:hypothetical protein AURDEDRAFT_131120 [Auricularia subglabra TFB-10046 SS5]|uniref:Uncharacterized protein n=1 Tax=Auricularia subglabra (strain TFB-10046 / SS5) TaxID=717982 RepID=J0D6M8_AURST|nr:hypothetical protein AURDEDRAFT_131120 [Auricularia subglabra TFB-10046 SS5]